MHSTWCHPSSAPCPSAGRDDCANHRPDQYLFQAADGHILHRRHQSLLQAERSSIHPGQRRALPAPTPDHTGKRHVRHGRTYDHVREPEIHKAHQSHHAPAAHPVLPGKQSPEDRFRNDSKRKTIYRRARFPVVYVPAESASNAPASSALPKRVPDADEADAAVPSTTIHDHASYSSSQDSTMAVNDSRSMIQFKTSNNAFELSC